MALKYEPMHSPKRLFFVEPDLASPADKHRIQLRGDLLHAFANALAKIARALEVFHVHPCEQRPRFVGKPLEVRVIRYLRNIVRIITETGLRIRKELLCAKKDQIDFCDLVFWIPDSKTPSGRAELPLTELAAEALRDQIELAGPGDWLFPSTESKSGHLETVKKAWRTTLERAEITYFRIYDLRSTFGTRLSAGGVSDEWVTQMLRQGDAKVFKKYSRMKLQMRREALGQLDRFASERNSVTVLASPGNSDTVLSRSADKKGATRGEAARNHSRIKESA